MRFLFTIVWSIHFFVITAFAQNNLFKVGVDQYNAGEFSEAIATFSTYLENVNRDKQLDDEAVFSRGMAYYKNGAFSKAVVDFKKALSMNKKNAGNLYWLIGRCKAFQGEHYHAIEFYTEALPFITDPKKQAQLFFERADSYKRIQQKDLAESDLKKALQLNPDHFLVQEALSEMVSYPTEASPKKSSDASTVKRIALIIGNSKYHTSVGPLKTPVNDAIAMHNELKKLKFETVLRLNLTASETTKAIRGFYVSLRKGNPSNTIALLYYAGYGVQVGGQNYLLPVDVLVKEPSDIERLCIPLDIVQDAIQYAGVTMSVMILDASHASPLADTFQSIQAGLAPPNPAVGNFIGYSTTPGTVTPEALGSHGLYTQELIKVLRVPGLNIGQVFKKVSDVVLAQSGGGQHTWNSSYAISDFYLNK